MDKLKKGIVVMLVSIVFGFLIVSYSFAGDCSGTKCNWMCGTSGSGPSSVSVDCNSYNSYFEIWCWCTRYAGDNCKVDGFYTNIEWRQTCWDTCSRGPTILTHVANCNSIENSYSCGAKRLLGCTRYRCVNSGV